jgi:hypothetical protein
MESMVTAALSVMDLNTHWCGHVAKAQCRTPPETVLICLRPKSHQHALKCYLWPDFQVFSPNLNHGGYRLFIAAQAEAA